MTARMAVKLVLNGTEVQSWVPANKSLLDALREDFGATDVKYGCGEGMCGTCTVLVDGEPTSSCLVFAVQTNGQAVRTVRGLQAARGELHPLQRAFLEAGASQCGFCTPGMILTAVHFLQSAKTMPTREEIRESLSGNYCRCTGYTKIIDAIENYAADEFA